MKFSIKLLPLVLLPLFSFGQGQVELFRPQLFLGLPSIRDVAISLDGEEMYFTIDDYKFRIGVIACVKKIGNKWSKPKVMAFSGNFRDIEPALSSDGKKLYFASNRPLDNNSAEPKDYDIWYVERKNLKSPWSVAKNLGSPVNSQDDEFYPSIAKNGNIYFTSGREGSKGKEDIFFSKLENGKYSEPISIDGEANTENYEFNAFVSPDEDFIIFTSIRKGEGSGRGDLYLSFKGTNNKWTKAKLLDSINSSSLDYCPFLDIINHKLYFTSLRSTIQNYYPIKLSYSDILRMYNKEPNGMSRLYQVDFNIDDFKN